MQKKSFREFPLTDYLVGDEAGRFYNRPAEQEPRCPRCYSRPVPAEIQQWAQKDGDAWLIAGVDILWECEECGQRFLSPGSATLYNEEWWRQVQG